ncbi:MAG: hypothetical protein ICV62_18220 [Cyanobacteria bacterium Co-bin13]|nr:hypothetical protein [Cyanobacteria bacterium Co-bin13]
MTEFSGSSGSGSSSWIAHLSEQDIQALAQSLRRIDTGMMKAGSQAGHRLWYQGKEPYFDVIFELVSQADFQHLSDEAIPDSINWCQFTLRGKVLLWQRQPSRLQTGETEELDVPPMLAYYAASKTIRDGARLDEVFVDLAQQILQARLDEPYLYKMGQILQQCKG